MCGQLGHLSRVCPMHAPVLLIIAGDSKDKGTGDHGPQEKHIVPNERGWLKKTMCMFEGCDSVEEVLL